MVKIVDFFPIKDRPSGLKDDIRFSITELGPFEPNSTVPQLEDTSFIALTDLEAKEASTQNGILYVNVSPNASTSKIIVDNLSLTPATQQQVLDEIQRVSALREQVRSGLSSLVALRFDGKSVLTQADKDTIAIEKVTLTRAVKGEILDLGAEFLSISTLSTFAFTNFIVASAPKFTQVKELISGTEIKVDKIGIFQKGEFLCIVNPRYALEGALRNGFFDNPDQFTPRDLIFLKVKDLNLATSILVLEPTILSPMLDEENLFSNPEMQSINEDKDTVLIMPGVPILLKQKAGDFTISLQEAVGLVEAEIPVTRLYAPKTPQPDGQTKFIGNLDRTSVAVTMYDDDNEVVLVKQGEAQPGVSVDYRLVTEKGSENYGNVDVFVKLKASPAKVPISGVASQGANAVKLAVRIASTPGRLTSLGSAVDSNALGNLSGLDAALEVQAAAGNFSKEDKEPGEFYFNFQIKTSDGKLVNLNRYGTIRIFDKITFKWKEGNQEKSANAVVRGVDEKNSFIILERPLSQNLPNGTIVEIPQTPLNPGRKYRITINCQDRQGPTGFSPTTPQPPQSI